MDEKHAYSTIADHLCGKDRWCDYRMSRGIQREIYGQRGGFFWWSRPQGLLLGKSRKMSTLEIDFERIENAIEYALDDSIEILKEWIKKITPRDPLRPPKDMSQHVTGNLRNSIDNEKLSRFSYLIGTQKAELSYAGAQEFGTEHIPARSYLRQWLKDNKRRFVSNLQNVIKKRLSK